MGRTEVTATIIGPMAEKEFEFLVDTGSTYVGLPPEDIQELGLIRVPGGRMEFGAPDGIVVRDTYGAFGRFRGRGFNATIIATSIPIIGYELLEHLRFKVNLVTQQLEPVPADEIAPPYIM